ncbi:MAG: helix-turn-helix domain-containing protein [Cyanobacteriota bacterium]|nr:helix-turn-helix domain-containing protein [Cyanobacteriota bacterium]
MDPNHDLSPEVKHYLQQQLKFHPHPDVRERILILLLRHQGRTQREIADLLGCSLRKVAYWSVHGDPWDLDSLVDKRMQGNYQKVTDAYLDRLFQVVSQKPQDLGYGFKTWSQQKLANHMEQETGIKLSASQLGRILRASQPGHGRKATPPLSRSTPKAGLSPDSSLKLSKTSVAKVS